MPVYDHFRFLFHAIFLMFLVVSSQKTSQPPFFVANVFVLCFYHVKCENVFGYLASHEGKNNLKLHHFHVPWADFWLTT